MQRSVRIVCGIGLLSLAFTSGASAESAEEVMKKITELNKSVKSMTADVKTVSNIENEMMKQNSLSDGKYEYVFKDGKAYVRMEGTSKSSMEMMGNKQETNSTMLTITDGEFSWTYTEVDGQKSVIKTKFDTTMDPRDPFATVREMYNVKVLPDETVDGESTYVLEFTPKAGTPGMEGTRMVQYFRKDTGMAAKVVSYDSSNKPTMTVTYSNVAVNPSISPDRFKFTPPAGVEITDMTNQ